jgi:uncharacterized membrane protein YkvA (DUF1232 family)
VAGSWWVNLLISVAAALVVAWLGLIVALLIARPRGASLTGALRILPDVIRLLRRLAADPALPRGVRIRLGLLLAYLACPIDIVPDFIPIIGYADDAIIVLIVLRGVARRAGLQAVRDHWPGTEDGFAALCRLAHLHHGAHAEAALPGDQHGADRLGGTRSGDGDPR